MLIRLNGIKIFAHHGVYEEELINGNNFQVDIDVDIALNEPVKHLSETVDYVILYNVVRKRMSHPTKLLETLVVDLANEIGDSDIRIKGVSLTIKKLSPPIKDFTGSVGVSYKKTF